MNPEEQITEVDPLKDSLGSDQLSTQDFISLLWNRKWLITGFALCGCLAGLLFILVMPPSYRAIAYLGPSPVFDFPTLNPSDSITVTSEDAFLLGLAALHSRDLRFDVFRRNKQWFSQYPDNSERGVNKSFQKDFQHGLSVTIHTRLKNGAMNIGTTALVSYLHSDNEHAVSILNDIVEAANDTVVNQFIFREQRRVANYISSLDVELKQAILLRKKINTSFLDNKIVQLRLEINTLKHRRESDRDMLRALYLQQPIEVSQKAVKPDKLAVLGLGAFAGLIFGVTAALILHSNVNRKSY